MFWGIEVGSKATSFTPAFDAHLTSACLSATATGNERNVLVVKTNGKEFSLCSLRLNALESTQVDLIFEEGQEVVFQVKGGGQTIHLTGYFVSNMDAPEDDNEDEEEDEEEMLEDLEDEEEEEEEVPPPKKDLKRKSEVAQPIKEVDNKKNKKETAVAKPVEQPKKVEEKPKTPEKKVEQPKTPEKKADQPSIKKLPNGLIIEEKVVGTGVQSTRGKKVSVKYIGKLTNGKTFDSSLNKPFTFKLGVGEVIKGWDLGVEGMKVGGKRRLTIPAALAYGNSGVPGIPGGSTLVFDVELCKVQQ